MVEKTKSDRAFELHLEEYRALRAEISSLQRQRFTTAQVGIAGIGTIWSFLVALDPCQTHGLFAAIGWLVPIFVALGGCLLTRYASLSILHGGAYLAMIEQHYSDKELGGWHNRSVRLRAAKERLKKDRKSPALIELNDYPDTSNDEMKAILGVLRERSENPRLSDALKKIWQRILVVTVCAALIGIGVVALAHRGCTKPDAVVLPVSISESL